MPVSHDDRRNPRKYLYTAEFLLEIFFSYTVNYWFYICGINNNHMPPFYSKMKYIKLKDTQTYNGGLSELLKGGSYFIRLCFVIIS